MAEPALTSAAVELLRIDAAAVVDEIVKSMRSSVLGRMRRKGGVLGLSGGIDSSVCAGLSARAFGGDRVLGLLMPETDSAPDTLELSELAASSCGVPTILEEISAILEAAGCYRRRDDAVREVVPDYGPGWRMKIVLPSVVDSDAYRIFSLVAVSPAGEQIRTRLSPQSYLTIVASTNFKQRTRMMLEYFHADRLNYAVIGTPNRLEHDQGFFVKNGDGSADFKPIAHLYKTQVYQVADYLGVPPEISKRPPTTDTYSLPQTQEEFYFSVPYDIMDVCLYGLDHAMPAGEVAELIGLDEVGVGRVFKDIITKRRTTAYLHTVPLLVSMGNDDAGLPA